MNAIEPKYAELELETRGEIMKLVQSMGSKPFTISQLAKRLFNGEFNKANQYLDKLVQAGGVKTIQADGALKFLPVIDKQERIERINTSIGQLDNEIRDAQSAKALLEGLKSAAETL